MTNRILEVYNDLFNNRERFIDEIFDMEIYKDGFPKLTVIDGGAYMGELGFYYYGVLDKYYGFEPDSKPFERLKTRVESFGMNRMIVSNKALGRNGERRVFHASGAGGSTLTQSTEGELGGSDIMVDTISLAQVIKENNIEKVDILKVDMENAEKEVFDSPDFPKVAKKIKLIIGEHLEDSRERLESLGFKMKSYPHGAIFTR